MRISTLTRILKDELGRSGDELPKWIDALVTPLNNMIENVGRALQNNLTLHENFLGFEVDRTITHDTPFIITAPNNLKIRGVLILDTGGKTLTGFRFTRLSRGLTINVMLVEGAGAQASMKFFILQG